MGIKILLELDPYGVIHEVRKTQHQNPEFGHTKDQG
jgi:hypothetical protein